MISNVILYFFANAASFVVLGRERDKSDKSTWDQDIEDGGYNDLYDGRYLFFSHRSRKQHLRDRDDYDNEPRHLSGFIWTSHNSDTTGMILRLEEQVPHRKRKSKRRRHKTSAGGFDPVSKRGRHRRHRDRKPRYLEVTKVRYYNSKGHYSFKFESPYEGPWTLKDDEKAYGYHQINARNIMLRAGKHVKRDFNTES
ncbi:hypothetical protein Ddc_19084 [Ditylenchus destructor]|nr:hypothetical protein Ddc_19084 [Ditylenchus destructor]